MNKPEPMPTYDATQPSTWDLVVADMQERDLMGRAKYGTPLQPLNGRDSLVDAYQEALDLVVYLRNEIEERRRITSALDRLRRLAAAHGDAGSTVSVIDWAVRFIERTEP